MFRKKARWKHQLYASLDSISQNIQENRVKHAEQGRETKDELISDVLFVILHMDILVLAGQGKTYIPQLCETGWRLEKLSSVMSQGTDGENFF